MKKELTTAVRDGKNVTYINTLQDTYEKNIDEMATAVLTKSANPHSTRYPATDTANTTWTSLVAKLTIAQKMESDATTTIETAEEELTELEDNDEERETVIQRRNAAQKSQCRAQKMRQVIQTLATTTLEQALLIYSSSQTTPDPHQEQTSPSPITDEMDSPMTQSLNDRKRKAAAMERPKEIVAEGVHALHWSAVGMSEFRIIEGFIIRHRTSYKDLQVSNREKTGKEWVKFLSLKLLDNTGVIEVTAWRDIATRLHATMMNTFGPVPDDEEETHHLVRITQFDILPTTGQLLSPTKRIAATMETKVEKISTSTATSLGKTHLPPSDAGFVKDFTMFRNVKPDFQVNLMGHVVASGNIIQTSTGQEMINFQLMDALGHWISCAALGVLTKSAHLQEGNQIMIYFAQGRRGRGERKGTFWLYDQSYVVKIRFNGSLPTAREEITIPGEEKNSV